MVDGQILCHLIRLLELLNHIGVIIIPNDKGVSSLEYMISIIGIHLVPIIAN